MAARCFDHVRFTTAFLKATGGGEGELGVREGGKRKVSIKEMQAAMKVECERFINARCAAKLVGRAARWEGVEGRPLVEVGEGLPMISLVASFFGRGRRVRETIEECRIKMARMELGSLRALLLAFVEEVEPFKEAIERVGKDDGASVFGLGGKYRGLSDFMEDLNEFVVLVDAAIREDALGRSDAEWLEVKKDLTCDVAGWFSHWVNGVAKGMTATSDLLRDMCVFSKPSQVTKSGVGNARRTVSLALSKPGSYLQREEGGGESFCDATVAYGIFNDIGRTIKGSEWFAAFKSKVTDTGGGDKVKVGKKRKSLEADNAKWLRFQMSCHELIVVGLVKRGLNGTFARGALVYTK